MSYSYFFSDGLHCLVVDPAYPRHAVQKCLNYALHHYFNLKTDIKSQNMQTWIENLVHGMEISILENDAGFWKSFPWNQISKWWSQIRWRTEFDGGASTKWPRSVYTWSQFPVIYSWTCPQQWRIQTFRWGKGGGGAVPPKFFSALRAPVWSKNKGGAENGRCREVAVVDGCDCNWNLDT